MKNEEDERGHRSKTLDHGPGTITAGRGVHHGLPVVLSASGHLNKFLLTFFFQHLHHEPWC